MLHALGDSWRELSADLRELRRQGPWRPKPEKGLRRVLLCACWLGVHVNAAVWMIIYGAFSRSPGLAAVWLFFTSLAGLCYLLVTFSDPGFVSAPALQEMIDAAGLQISVTAPDEASAGTLESGECKSSCESSSSDVPGAAAAGTAGGIELRGVEHSAENADAATAEMMPVIAVGAGKATLSGAAKGASSVVRELEVVPGDDGSTEGAGAAHDRVTQVDGGLSERYVWKGGSRLISQPDSSAPPPLSEPASRFFSHFSDKAGMLVPLRAKYSKKHQKIVAKFDHYCHLLGNSVGELNHGRFWWLLLLQVISIWLGKWLVDHAFIHVRATKGLSERWLVYNIPLLIIDLLSYIFGIPLAILLLIHSFHGLTSNTTYEFIKWDKIEYLKGFYEFTCPFSEGFWGNLGRFCCPRGFKLWERPAPEGEWPENCWRNRYWSCCA